MKKRIGLVGAIALVAASVVLPAAAVSAADTQCPTGYYCYWNNTSYGGAFGNWNSTRNNMGIATDNVTNMNDVASSQWVRWGKSVRIWEDTTLTGRSTDFANGSKNTSLGSFNANLGFAETWSDRISSFTKLP